MDLLFESKRAWLLPYCIFCCLAIAISQFWYDKDWLRTICLMMGTMLSGMVFCFILMVLFRWITWVRRILVVMYIGATVYGWINNYIKRWYVIIPSFLIMSFFMMWNLGGVKNCIIASAYRAKLNNLISRVNSEYDKYSSGVDRYNARNGLGFFNKVRKKRKVNLAWYGFNSSGINMFALEDAVFGVSTSVWKTKVGKLNKKISRISDKNDAIFADETISDERRRFNDVKKMNGEMGYYNPDYDKISVELDSQKKKGIKAQKKILKKRI